MTVLEVLSFPTSLSLLPGQDGEEAREEEGDGHDGEEPWCGYGEALWDGKIGGAVPFAGRDGKVRLETAITERCLVEGDRSCVVLRVTNDSTKKVRTITLRLDLTQS